METDQLKAILESLLFAAGEPVALSRLAAVFDNTPREEIRKALEEMAVVYASAGRGLVLDEVAGGYQLRTAPEYALYVRKLLAAKPPRLSRPLLETLAIIAYRQPVTRPEIEQFRGVDSGGVLETLLERRMVRIAGRKEAPGRPIQYATTAEFLEVFGLKDLNSLPDLEEFTQIRQAGMEQSGAGDDPAQSTEAQSPDTPAERPPQDGDESAAGPEQSAPPLESHAESEPSSDEER